MVSFATHEQNLKDLTAALLRLPPSSSGCKDSLPLRRRGGFESGLLNEPHLSGLRLGLACRLESRGGGSFRGRSLCGLAGHCLAPVSLSLRDPAVAGCDDLRASLYSLLPLGVFRHCPSTLDLSLLRSAGSA
jgi:hypothetical protein